MCQEDVWHHGTSPSVFRLRKNRQMMFYLLTFACQITKWVLAERSFKYKVRLPGNVFFCRVQRGFLPSFSLVVSFVSSSPSFFLPLSFSFKQTITASLLLWHRQCNSFTGPNSPSTLRMTMSFFMAVSTSQLVLSSVAQ